MNPLLTHSLERATSYLAMMNGKTHDPKEQTWFKCLKILLMFPNFKGVLTHMHGTVNAVNYLFDGEVKVHYFKLGYPDVPIIKKPTNRINFLFTNSYGGQPFNFTLRGGQEAIEAFKQLHRINPKVHLTVCGPTEQCNLSHPNITVYSGFVSNDVIDGEFNKAHFLLLPSFRVHSISLLKAFAHGVIPVVSDGWGFDEFVPDCIVRDTCSHISWTDHNGLMQENYALHYGINIDAVEKIIARCQQLIDSDTKKMSNEMRDRARSYSVRQCNTILKEIFEKSCNYSIGML